MDSGLVLARAILQTRVPASITPLKSEDHRLRLVVLDLDSALLHHPHRRLAHYKTYHQYLVQASRILTGHCSRNRRWAYSRDPPLLEQVRQDILLVLEEAERVL